MYFSIYLHLIPVKTKSGPSNASAFRSIFHYDNSRRSVWVLTDKGKEFLNKQFQDMLRKEGIQFVVCKYPDVKCAVEERDHKPIHDRLNKYFKYKIPTDI